MKVYGLPEGQGLECTWKLIYDDSHILSANDTEFCVFHANFTAGTINWYRPGPYQMIVPGCTSTKEYWPACDVFYTNEKTCYIYDMH